MALPIWTKYMVKVLGDKSLGYDENETFQLPEGYDPVSYTHLDVYKRQPLYRLR